jgi:hypothetical protein
MSPSPSHCEIIEVFESYASYRLRIPLFLRQSIQNPHDPVFTPPLPRHWRTMGQVQFGRCSRKLPKKVLATPRGNFENSTNYHVSFEALYGICSPRGDSCQSDQDEV